MNREAAVRERRVLKQAKKDARKQAAAEASRAERADRETPPVEDDRQNRPPAHVEPARIRAVGAARSLSARPR